MEDVDRIPRVVVAYIDQPILFSSREQTVYGVVSGRPSLKFSPILAIDASEISLTTRCQ